MKKLLNEKGIHFILFIILFSIPLILPLLHKGFFVSDDGEWMIIRLSDFHRSFRDGQFPVRWAGRLNQEYGYPVFNFLYPGMLYLGEIIHLLGFNFINSVKFLFGLSFVLSGVFSFLWLSQFFNKFSSFIGAVSYMYAPYFFFDVYKRGSLGEVLALTVIPLCLLTLQKKSFLLGSITFALLILMHNTIAFLITPLLMVYLLIKSYKYLKKESLLKIINPILGGLGLSAFFWIPALYDKQFTIFDQVTVSRWQEHFLKFDDLWLVGIIMLFTAMISLLTIKKRDILTILFLFAFLVSVFMTLPVSGFVWNLLPFTNLIQFPFRFISLTMISGAFITAFVSDRLKKELKIVVGVLIIMANILIVAQNQKKIEYIDRPESYYATNEATTNTQDEYMPKWVKVKPEGRPENKVEIIAGQGEVNIIKAKSNQIVFDVNAVSNITTQINMLYFPGWEIYVNNKKWNINYENDRGVMRINLQQGQYKVSAKFQETPIRLISDIISLVTFIILCGLFIKKGYAKHS